MADIKYRNELMSIAEQALKEGDEALAMQIMDEIESLNIEKPKVEQTQGDINTKRLMDVVGPVAQFGGRVFDETTNLIGDIPVIGGGTKSLIRGVGRGLGNVVEGTSQAIYDVGGQITGIDTSDQLSNIREFKESGDAAFAPIAEEYPIMANTGQFIGNVAPFMVGGSIPALLASGTAMGATQYQEGDQGERNSNRTISTLAYPAVGLLTGGTINVASKGTGSAIQGLKNTVADVKAQGAIKGIQSSIARAINFADDVAPKGTVGRKIAETATKAAFAVGTGGSSLVVPTIAKTPIGKAMMEPVKESIKKTVGSSISSAKDSVKGIDYAQSPMANSFKAFGKEQMVPTSIFLNELIGGE